MQWYQIRCEVKSWLSSEWQADTIWGHLCWGLTHLRGEEELSRFIAAYESNEPPLLISNGRGGSFDS